MNSIRRGQIAQNIYSAQSCVKGSDCQTNPNLIGSLCAIAFPMEQNLIHAPIDAREKTTVSCGSAGNTCMYITGIPGRYKCACTERSRCLKGNIVGALRVSPECFTIQVRP